MNYYEHHIGDFLKKTVHLTAVEEGIYRRLLDRYYTTERPLPTDLRECCKLARATTKAERDAVRDVLKDFFELQEDGHHQRRADQEIARFQEKSAKAKRSAEARWGASKPQSEGNANAYANASDDDMRTHCEGNATRARPHTPDTSNQSPELNTDTHTATEAGRVCRLMRKAGIPDGSPGHNDLIALINAGASDAEFESAARTAVEKGKGFAYALGVLKGRRTEAADAAKRMHRGALPQATGNQDRKSRQLETAALMTGAARAAPPPQPQPETIDVESRVIAPRILG